MVMTSASSSGSVLPIASTPSWVCSRNRPACGASYRNMGPVYQSFTGSGSLCMPCSTKARTTPAVPSGRSVMDRPPRSSNVYISLRTMSVLAPTPRANTSVCSNVGVVMWP